MLLAYNGAYYPIIKSSTIKYKTRLSFRYIKTKLKKGSPYTQNEDSKKEVRFSDEREYKRKKQMWQILLKISNNKKEEYKFSFIKNRA